MMIDIHDAKNTATLIDWLRDGWHDPQKRSMALASVPGAAEIAERLAGIREHLNKTPTAAEQRAAEAAAAAAVVEAEKLEKAATEAELAAMRARQAADRAAGVQLRGHRARTNPPWSMHVSYLASIVGDVRPWLCDWLREKGLHVDAQTHITEL